MRRFLPNVLLATALSLTLACGKTATQEATAPGGGPATTTPAAPAGSELETAQKENAALKETLGEKTQVLNQVQQELEALASTGEVVSATQQQLESGVKTREQGDILRENIEKAKKLLEERAERIKALEARISGSEGQLKQMVDLVGKLMVERSKEIDKLEGQIAKLRGEKRAVEEERDAERLAKEEESHKRQEAEQVLDTVYYAVGTEDELKERGILAIQKRGVLGMKKRISLAPIKSFEPFTKISLAKDEQIPLGKDVKTWEAASGHDLNKTNVEKHQNGDTFLNIHDPKTFWHEKVLVVVVTH
jgi:hypothetical protein